MSFTITIKNNENGEVLVNEENAVAIIGAFSVENGTAQMGFCACNTFDICRTINAAKKSIRNVETADPKISAFSELFDMLDENESTGGRERK